MDYQCKEGGFDEVQSHPQKHVRRHVELESQNGINVAELDLIDRYVRDERGESEAVEEIICFERVEAMEADKEAAACDDDGSGAKSPLVYLEYPC